MQWFASPTGKRGRTPTLSDAAIQFCLSIKCLFDLALRQALGFVQSLLRLGRLGRLAVAWPDAVCAAESQAGAKRSGTNPASMLCTGAALLCQTSRRQRCTMSGCRPWLSATPDTDDPD
jgi:hypothetical protein